MGCGASTEEERRQEKRKEEILKRAKLNIARRNNSNRQPSVTSPSSPSLDDSEEEPEEERGFRRVDTLELVLGTGSDYRTRSDGIMRRQPAHGIGGLSSKKYERDPTFGDIEHVSEHGSDSDDDDDECGKRIPGTTAALRILPASPPPQLVSASTVNAHRLSTSKESRDSDPLGLSQETLALELRSRLSRGSLSPKSQRRPTTNSFSDDDGIVVGLQRCESAGTLSTEPGPFSASINSSIRTLVAKVKCSDHEFEQEPAISSNRRNMVESKVKNWLDLSGNDDDDATTTTTKGTFAVTEEEDGTLIEEL